jgi:hypothetical protein
VREEVRLLGGGPLAGSEAPSRGSSKVSDSC